MNGFGVGGTRFEMGEGTEGMRKVRLVSSSFSMQGEPSMTINREEVKKIIEIKKMDLEECELEMNSRYYPAIVRIAIMNYMEVLRQQLDEHTHILEEKVSA